MGNHQNIPIRILFFNFCNDQRSTTGNLYRRFATCGRVPLPVQLTNAHSHRHDESLISSTVRPSHWPYRISFNPSEQLHLYTNSITQWLGRSDRSFHGTGINSGLMAGGGKRQQTLVPLTCLLALTLDQDHHSNPLSDCTLSPRAAASKVLSSSGDLQGTFVIFKGDYAPSGCPMVCTVIKLVVPDTPIAVPEVITTLSPLCAKPISTEVFTT